LEDSLPAWEQLQTNDDISMGDIKGFAIPIPPLAEQRRIVAKVEQLMAMVDALESQLATSGATAEKLLAAVVAELTDGTRASPAC
jgi:type I restriction enzyme S subunit